MRAFLKVAPVAAIIAIAALGAMSGKQASAAEFCRQDYMTSCGFYTMEQCKASSAGIGGDCFRDPSLNNSRDAFGYQPNSSHPKKAARPRRSEAFTRP